ncbi:MAG: hypothetical protein LBN34_05175 [Clostridiales Family XIII bacterium]|jgi:hypothetical protein|nr:hypothetical protein [Clostridiales Family XIII bacterium]
MLQKSGKGKFNRNITAILLIVGAAILVLGIVLFIGADDDAHGLSTLSGLLTGMGAAFFASGIFALVHDRKLTPEQKRQKEIEAADERSSMISSKAFVVAAIVGIALSFVAGVIFFAFDKILVGYVFIALMLVQTITYVVAYGFYNKRY